MMHQDRTILPMAPGWNSLGHHPPELTSAASSESVVSSYFGKMSRSSRTIQM
jgi:hypothetical protein